MRYTSNSAFLTGLSTDFGRKSGKNESSGLALAVFGAFGREGGAGGRLPQDLVNPDGGAEAFDLLRGQFDAGLGQFGIVALEGGVGCLADDDAAVAGNAFEAAGEVDLAAENGVIDDVGLGTHQADDGV